MAGVPEGIDREKASALGGLIKEQVIGTDVHFDIEEFKKLVRKDPLCKSLLKEYFEKAETPDPTTSQILFHLSQLEDLYAKCIRLLNSKDMRLGRMESLWDQLKFRVKELKAFVEQREMTCLKIRLGGLSKKRDGLPRISIDSLRSRLEKQTGIELNPPPHLE